MPFDVNYSSIGLTVYELESDTDSMSLIFYVDVNDSTGKLNVTFDRTFFDSIYDGVDDQFFILSDGDEIELNLDSTGENILDAAQKAGGDLPFACKGGVCCTCKAKILEGSASMDVNYALEPDEVEAGYILTCQAHPTSDKLVVSFDD